MTVEAEPTAAEAWAALEAVSVRPSAARRRFVERLRVRLPDARLPADGPLPSTAAVWSLVVGRPGWAAAVRDASEED